MPADKVTHYNKIDIGIFLLMLEVCLEHEEVEFDRTLFEDSGEEEKTPAAVYNIKQKGTVTV